MLEIRVPAENDFVFFMGHGTGTWGAHELVVLGPYLVPPGACLVFVLPRSCIDSLLPRPEHQEIHA